MSSPSNRRQRNSQSATLRRSAHPSSQPVSSPLFFQSSPPRENGQDGAGANVSSPLRYNSDTQSTHDARNHDEESQRTPRASSLLAGGKAQRPRRRLVVHAVLTQAESSPIRYEPSSSPGRSQRHQSELRSESSGLFVASQRGAAAAYRRGDINSDSARTPRAHRRVILDDAGHVVREGQTPGSDAGSFSNRDPNTSEADALGGHGDSLIWGTTVSIDDTFASFKDFLRNFTAKYRMYRDGLSDSQVAAAPDAESKPYWEALENMMLLGTTRLFLDISDLNLYPPTRKLWHQIQAYPQEIVPVMDQSVHDLMVELARADGLRNRPSQHPTQSSEPALPSSDRPEDAATPRAPQDQQPSLEDQVAASVYVVRPFGLDRSINLRDLNPSGKWPVRRTMECRP